MILKKAYEHSVEYLRRCNADEAEFKALCLVCHIDTIKNSDFHMHLNDEIDEKKMSSLLHKLKQGEPLQYVLGKWDFYESEFFVGRGVLIPRPETEEIVELAIKECFKYSAPVIYDLCAGSGCIGLSVAKKIHNAEVYLVEKSEEAMFYLNKNAKGIENAKVIHDDINNDIELPYADIIISNPPYIRSNDIKALQKEVLYEPLSALDGGYDGLDFYRIINDKWSVRLKSGGTLILEIGNDQGKSVSELLTYFKTIQVIKDIYGNNRIIKAIRP